MRYYNHTFVCWVQGFTFQIVFIINFEVINAITSINEFLRDKSLELKEEEELFNTIKNFEQVQKYILEEIKKIGK